MMESSAYRTPKTTRRASWRVQDECEVVGLDEDCRESRVECHGPHEVFKDAITGQVLDPQLVRLARKEELAYFESKGAWPRSEAYQCMGRPPIAMKWVDTNKGMMPTPSTGLAL